MWVVVVLLSVIISIALFVGAEMLIAPECRTTSARSVAIGARC